MKNEDECASSPPFSPTKRELIMISSYQRRLQEQQNKHYKTIEQVWSSLPPPPEQPLYQNQTSIINMELDQNLIGQQLSFSQSPQKRKKDDSIRKLAYLNTSSKNKNLPRYPEGFRQVCLKKSNNKGMKVIAKYKFPPSEERMPMKKYIKIEKIHLPKSHQSILGPSLVDKSAGISSDSIRKTINEYDSYLQKIVDYNKTERSQSNYNTNSNKYHKRNYSSSHKSGNVRKDKQNKTSSTNTGIKINYLDQNKKIVEDFNIRKPALRKDYFVFGMSDRPNTENKTEYFRDMLWKINFSNGLYVQTPEVISNSYRAYIGPGNNYYLVKGVLKRRFWWTVIDKPDNSNSWKDIQFVWTQLKQNNIFKMQKNCNKKHRRVLEETQSVVDEQNEDNNREQAQQNVKQKDDGMEEETLQEQKMIKQKKKTSELKYRILKRDSSNMNENITSDLQNHRKIFYKTDNQVWQNHFFKNFKTQQKINQNTYSRRTTLFFTKQITHIENSDHLKVHNHLESNFFIGNKKALFYNVRKYCTLKGIDPFTFIPMTFHISKGVEDPQFKVFKQMYDEIQGKKNQNGLKNMWIVKPGQNTNRGNGISVSYSLDDVKVRLKGRQRNADGKLRTFIVQKYLEKPLLYNKRKFDIRHYMLVTCINGSIKGYWYEEGYIRTSSFQYSLKYCKDPLVHLTNDAIQKNCSSYGKYEKGNKLSYADFQKYLDNTVNLGAKNKKKINFFDDILPQLKNIATDSLRASYALLDPHRKQRNFQLLGLDFMLDEDLRPWLIEVNTNPCLQSSCSLLQKIIPQLIDNVFKICIDPLFPPPENWQAGKKFYFGDNPLSENKFQIIFDEDDDGRELQKIYKEDVGQIDEKMGKVQEDNEIFEDDGDQEWQAANNKKF